ncbi:uncharacterized protein PAC_12323 [Phialocephala subalpina]|uniref:Uncharacterized protein n=1 Tax=Phialocephala subalpina TaxID=576137 RepID=A0A1L7XBP9_9HELO|nr:uncharacterized protein PAC_12323 [Phialocephala subalpina]
MPPIRDLKAFLRKEVKKGRIETPPAPPPQPKQTLGKPPLSLPRIKSFKKPGPSSLFGDTITTNSQNNDDSGEGSWVNKGTNASGSGNFNPTEQRIEQFLVGGSTKNPSTLTRPSKNSELDVLRKELEDVVSREAVAGRHEKKAIRKEKAALIEKISRLERAARRANVKKIMQPFLEPISKLSEPVTPEEKKNLMRQANLIEQARASPHTSSRKRARDGLDEDLLDGEDRLKFGLKRSRGEKATGHWRTTLNDYMPESQVDTETLNRINALSPEERKADRPLINEYLRNAALVDRFDRRMERKLEDLKRAKIK